MSYMDKKNMEPFNTLWDFECGSSIINTKCTIGMTRIAIACVDRCLYLVDQNGSEVWKKELDYEAWCVDISRDGSKIAVGTANQKPSSGSIYLFNNEGKELFKHTINAPIWGLSFSEDAKCLVATSWNNRVYLLKDDNATYSIREKLIGKYGLYGVKYQDEKIFVNSYQDGLYCLDNDLNILKKCIISDGLYGIDVINRKVIIALRQGKVAIIGIDELFSNQKIDYTKEISSRPLCGVSSSANNTLIVSGSFDGIAYLTTEFGDCLWKFETDGEIWSVNINEEGSRVLVGSGDKKIYFLKNNCTASIIKEILLLEDRLVQQNHYNNIIRLLDLYLSIGVIEYGVKRIEKILGKDIDKALLDYLLEKSIDFLISDLLLADLCFKYGKKLFDNNYVIKAIEYYQKASKDIKLSNYALNKAGECFQILGYETSFQASFNRAKIKFLKEDEKKIIYNLARSYEESGFYKEALKHFELLLSWDITYRDVLQKHTNLLNKENSKTDLMVYTGHTVSLLGQDFPVNVDSSLRKVIHARSNELLITEQERKHINDAFNLSKECEYFSNIKVQQLSYESTDYFQYDTLPLEDEVKKTLEMINFLSIFTKHQDRPRKSLDIGTATGRYPFVLKQLGIETFGIDKEKNSIDYINQKRKMYGIDIEDSPFLKVGDVINLADYYKKNSFDLITCMMGTFAHFGPEKRHAICEQIREVLTPKGLFVVSTWDIECEHLNYLSMYSQSQRELIKNNSLKNSDLKELFEADGFQTIQYTPFAFLSDLFSHELRMNNFSEIDARRLMEFDLATRSLLLNAHGQMYMFAFVKK